MTLFLIHDEICDSIFILINVSLYLYSLYLLSLLHLSYDDVLDWPRRAMSSTDGKTMYCSKHRCRCIECRAKAKRAEVSQRFMEILHERKLALEEKKQELLEMMKEKVGKERSPSVERIRYANEWNRIISGRFHYYVDTPRWVKEHHKRIVRYTKWQPNRLHQHSQAYSLLADYINRFYPGDRECGYLESISLLDVGLYPEQWCPFAEPSIVFAVDDCDIVDFEEPHQIKPHKILASFAYITVWSRFPSRRREARKKFYKYIKRFTQSERMRLILSNLDMNFD